MRCKALIEGKADLNAKTPEGFSPLVIALDNLHFDAAKVLVEAGASADDGGLFAVVEARNRVNYVGEFQVPTGAESSLEVLKLMLASGADLTSRLPDQLLDRDARFLPPPPKLTDLALIRAARSSDVEAMRVLVEAGADPSLRDEKRGGITPLVAVMIGPRASAAHRGRAPADRGEGDRRDRLSPGSRCEPEHRQRTSAPRLCTSAALRDYPAVIKHMAERGVNLNVADQRRLHAARLRASATCRRRSARSRRAGVTAAANALRELGARGKEEQRTAAR